MFMKAERVSQLLRALARVDRHAGYKDLLYRCALIYNPYAGKLRRHPEIVGSVIAALGGDVRTLPTTGPNVAGDLAREAIADGANKIVVLGGDGTINETANVMVGSDVPLAVLPGGTANVLCMELGLGGNAQRAARRIGDLVPRRIAVGRIATPVESRYFLLMAGAGIDAQIVHLIDPRLKAALGKVSYWIGGFGLIAQRLPEFDVVDPAGHHRASFALVSRVRNYGGDLEIARGIRLTTPDFETVSFAGEWAPRYLKYLAGVFVNKLAGLSGVSVRRTTNIEIGPGAPLQIDGEAAGYSPAKIEIVPDALTLLMPREYGGDAWQS